MAKRKKLKVDKSRFKRDKKYAIVIIAILLLTPVFDYFYDEYLKTELAKDAIVVTLEKCVDGDTARFSTVGNTRFLFVDTPESTKEIEPFGKEAAAFTCEMLSNANEIKLVFDGERQDKYERTLAWVFADGILVQEALAENGLVEDFYDYGDYAYEQDVRDAYYRAQQNKVGIYAE